MATKDSQEVQSMYPRATALDVYSTDDESTGQGCAHKDKKLEGELGLQKIISKNKSDAMFELRKLALQQKPVSEFGSRQILEEHIAHHTQPTTQQEDAGNIPASELNTEAVNISARVQQLEPLLIAAVAAAAAAAAAGAGAGGAAPQTLRPEEIQQDMQALQELRVVNEILQGPVQEEIDRTLREGQAHGHHPHRRPRPLPRPRAARAEEGAEGGDEMNQTPIGRLLAVAGQSRRQRGRRVRFRPQVPTPNADGRYSVPQRNQNEIVQRLRQSPALNSLGEEARDEILAEVGNLVSQQLVTSALSGDFRGILELHVQSRADQINSGHVISIPRQRAVRHDPQFSDDERESAPSASYVRELRQDMVIMKGQLNELKQMMRVSFDLQLDIQRAVHQEVAAALACLSQPNATIDGGSVPTSRSALGACPIPTLGGNEREKVVESGHCVICSEGVIDCVIYHCGHMCTCVGCGLELKSKALKCPICRAPITDVIRTYASMK